MKGQNMFTSKQIEEIKSLLRKKIGASPEEQKRIRKELRDVHKFYISDFTSKKGYTTDDLKEHIHTKQVKVIG